MKLLKDKGKLITVLILIFIMVNINGIAFGFWDLTASQDGRIISLGDRAEITVTASVKTDKKLVPLGSFKAADETDEYIIDYLVTFNKPGYLYVEVDEDGIKIGDGNHAFNSLAVVQIYTDYDELGAGPNLSLVKPFNDYDSQSSLYYMTVYIRVTIAAPQNPADYEAAYEALCNQTATFRVTFKANEALS